MMQTSRVRAGYRGRVLLSLAALDAVYAWGIYLANGQSRPPGSFAYIDRYVPLVALAILWAAVAVICAVFAFKANDRLGWAVAISIKIFWGAMILIGWLAGDIPFGYLTAVVWWVIASIVWTASRWPDPKKPGGV
jgi:hypothetical protein